MSCSCNFSTAMPELDELPDGIIVDTELVFGDELAA
jgi:hypothetical protein